MPQYKYPGVYIQEVSSGLKTITGVQTSTAAFIDFFKEGPSNKPVQILGLGDFSRIFGGLDDRSEASYAINLFFLNGGTRAFVVRVANNDPENNKPFRKAQVVICSDPDGANQALLVWAANEGDWGNNLRVDVNQNTSDPANRFNLLFTRYDSAADNAKPLVTDSYVNLSMDKDDARYAVNVVNNESMLVRLERKSADGDKAIPVPTGLRSGDLAGLTPAQIGGLDTRKLKVKMGSSAAIDVTINYPGGVTVDDLVGLRKYLELAIRTADKTNNSFTGASVELVVSNEGGPVKQCFRILSGKKGDSYAPSETITCTDSGPGNVATVLKLTGAGIWNNVQEYIVGATADAGAQKSVANGTGGDGDRPGVDDIIGSKAMDPFTGMYSLEYADLFNLLCIPRTAELSQTAMQVVVGKALSYCEEKRAFMIIDIPKTINDVGKMREWIDANAKLRHMNAATYFPRLVMADPLKEHQPRDVAASGTMAGLYAHTDFTRGVWKAAAGTEAVLRGVTGLAVELTDVTNSLLNLFAINCLRKFPIYGMVSWGARTLDGSDQAGSEWEYIPVRRLALFLEESLFRGTKWVVFEANDESLWAKIRMNIGAFMMSLFRQGAFQGTTPDNAFYVKCDSETTTQDDRNHGVVNIEVGFAPLKPAEFVVLRFKQIIQKD